MFYFYGGKRRLARSYPAPRYNVIVEPFAGSAAYSVTHLMPSTVRDPLDKVILIEKDKRVYDTWMTLLGMDADEIRNYPIPEAGERTSDFLVMTSAVSNRIARQKEMIVTERMPVVLERMFRQIADVLPHVKGRVEIHHGNYTDADDIEATWFIDPPYHVGSRAQQRGMGYAEGCNSASIDYEVLGEWCRSRRGQKIVCEQDGATWLPFEHLTQARDSIGNFQSEVVWIETSAAAPALAPARTQTKTFAAVRPATA